LRTADEFVVAVARYALGDHHAVGVVERGKQLSCGAG
jgi:hypothetical protein